MGADRARDERRVLEEMELQVLVEDPGLEDALRRMVPPPPGRGHGRGQLAKGAGALASIAARAATAGRTAAGSLTRCVLVLCALCAAAVVSVRLVATRRSRRTVLRARRRHFMKKVRRAPPS